MTGRRAMMMVVVLVAGAAGAWWRRPTPRERIADQLGIAPGLIVMIGPRAVLYTHEAHAEQMWGASMVHTAGRPVVFDRRPVAPGELSTFLDTSMAEPPR